MTEGRVRELASLTSLDLLKADEEMMPSRAEKNVLEKLIRTVAAEARNEGIEKMRDAVYNNLNGDVDFEFLDDIAQECIKEKKAKCD